jgi:thiazole synthase
LSEAADLNAASQTSHSQTTGDNSVASYPADRPLKIGAHELTGRLIVGTGKYETMELMRDSLLASGADVVTVAVRRERMYEHSGRNLLDFIDPQRYLLLPNTAGCYNASDAVRVARMGRQLLSDLGNPGADWVKLEVLGDTKTLLPDPVATLTACETGRRGLSSTVLHQ